jgi:hypothetical protein
MVEAVLSPRAADRKAALAEGVPGLLQSQSSTELIMKRTVSRTLSVGPSKTIKVTFESREPNVLGSSPTKEGSMATVGESPACLSFGSDWSSLCGGWVQQQLDPPRGVCVQLQREGSHTGPLGLSDIQQVINGSSSSSSSGTCECSYLCP